MSRLESSPVVSPWPGPRTLGTVVGAVAGLAVLFTLGAPGITSDEPIDVKVGRNYLIWLDIQARRGLESIGQAQIDALFRDNAQHPPLGRLLLGLASRGAESLEGVLGGPDPFSVHAARVAPALAFGFLVGLIVQMSTRRYGTAAGLGAGVSLVLMPRVFAHAHFATLDTFLSLFWTLALFSADSALSSRRPVVRMALAGGFWGLALLTKLHAWLLPPLVLGLAIARIGVRGRMVGALTAWAVVGLSVFLVGWPWLWADPIARLSGFLSTSIERAPLPVLYFGHVYRDTEAPWHYPWVYFATTIPIGLLAFGSWGAGRALANRRLDPLPLILLASILEFMLVFSTKAPVYDGERLFLLVFPAASILIGIGFDSAWKRTSRTAWRVALILTLGSQGYGLIATYPFGLSYFNLLVGGLRGAERLGMEVTYWGDAIDRRLLAELASRAQPGDLAAVAPSLHHLYPPALTTRALLEGGVTLVGDERVGSAAWLIVSRREALLRPEIRRLLAGSPEAESRRDGVWLARLYRLRQVSESDASLPRILSERIELSSGLPYHHDD